MENRRAGAIMMVLMIMVTFPLVVMGGPVLHKVGGSKGWTNHDVNYTQWSAQEHVFLGDWLLFNFDKRYFNVLEVNETSYEKCIDEGFMKNVTQGGRDVMQLTEARTYYYLSSGGYCFQGMKVAVHVVQQDEQAPAPASTQTSAEHRILPNILLYLMGVILYKGIHCLYI